MRKYKVMVSVGEASGDVHVANAVAELQQLPISTQLFGVGGPKLAALGMRIDVDSREISVMGIVEVLKRYRALIKIIERLRDIMREEKPDLLLLADAPNFNLKLAETAKALGIPVLYYISPKIWAWREKRIHQIGNLVSMMAVIFPFEIAYYERANIPVRYVGNPVVDEVLGQSPDPSFRQKHGIPDDTKLIALLPGSRYSELNRLLDTLLESAIQLDEQMENVHFVLPLANTFDVNDIKMRIQKKTQTSNTQIHLVTDATHAAMQSADVTIAASGTATLEIALLDTPMVVIYKVNALTYALVKPLLKIKDVCLVNIVAGRRVVPELLQKEANPNKIAQETLKLLNDPTTYTAQKQSLAEVREKLGDAGSSKKVAGLVQEMLLRAC